jgi:hypothetical protein
MRRETHITKYLCSARQRKTLKAFSAKKATTEVQAVVYKMSGFSHENMTGDIIAVR